MPKAALLLVLLLAGCSTSRTVTTHVPAEQPSLSVSTDTVHVASLAPLPRGGVRTLPQQVRRAARPTEGPSVPIASITVDDEEVTVRTDSAEYVFRRPAFGESLDVRADTLDLLRGALRGAPQERTLDAEVVERESPFAVFWRSFQWAALTVVVVLALALLYRLTSLFT